MKNGQSLTITPILLFIILIFVSGCASTNKMTLNIDPSHVIAMQDMRTEITGMLEDLDYQWHPIQDETTGQKLKVAEKYGQYRMLFKHIDDVSVQVEVHIRENDNMTGLHFSEIGTDKPSSKTMDYYHKLKARVIQIFGEDSVSSDKSFFMTP